MRITDIQNDAVLNVAAEMDISDLHTANFKEAYELEKQSAIMEEGSLTFQRAVEAIAVGATRNAREGPATQVHVTGAGQTKKRQAGRIQRSTPHKPQGRLQQLYNKSLLLGPSSVTSPRSLPFSAGVGI